jgi:hypothetical protein
MRIEVLAWLLLASLPGAALAGPPYATDDPEPVPLHRRLSML